VEGGRGAEAVPHARRIAELEPDDMDHHMQLVDLLLETGQIEDAIAALGPVLEPDACALEPRMYLYSQLTAREDYAGLSRVMEHGYEQCPESAWNLNAYAWVLATSPVDSDRDGARAVTMAERLVASVETDEMDPSYLDTLAAAHAAAGNFDQAIDTMLRAIALARRRGEPRERIESLEEHLADFRRGRPLRLGEASGG
jgi:tetratricopeptide (TPR) repeat protein